MDVTTIINEFAHSTQVTADLLAEAAAPIATPEHLQPFLESVLVTELAQALMNCIAAQQGQRLVPLTDLPCPARHALCRTATQAFSRHNPVIQAASQLHAAKALGLARYGTDWEHLTDLQQIALQADAGAVIAAYDASLARTVPEQRARQVARDVTEQAKRRGRSVFLHNRGEGEIR